MTIVMRFHAGPVEPSNFHLLPTTSAVNGQRHMVLEHDEEGPVLLIFPVRVDKRPLDGRRTWTALD